MSDDVAFIRMAEHYHDFDHSPCPVCAALDRLEARLEDVARAEARADEQITALEARLATAEAERDRARTDVLRYPGLSAVAAERDAARADAERLAETLRSIRDRSDANNGVWAAEEARVALAAHDNAEEEGA